MALVISVNVTGRELYHLPNKYNHKKNFYTPNEVICWEIKKTFAL